MFHPLLPDLTDLKDSELDLKISELNKKYNIAARTSGGGALLSQIILSLDHYQAEKQKRVFEKYNKVMVKNKDGEQNLDDLINID